MMTIPGIHASSGCYRFDGYPKATNKPSIQHHRDKLPHIQVVELLYAVEPRYAKSWKPSCGHQSTDYVSPAHSIGH